MLPTFGPVPRRGSRTQPGDPRSFDGRMAFIPEGQADRSQARSAWDSANPKSRPVGYGMIRAGMRTDST
jgi:hypothetical protein